MDETDLQLFLRIQQRASMSAAARELQLSVATVSARLANLERSLGVRLFNRSTRRLSLTDDGRALLPHAERLLEGMQEARAALTPSERSLSGTLRITASSSFGRQHLIPALSGLMQQHPQLKVDLQLSDHIVDLLDSGCDVGIRIAADLDPGLVARRLCSDQRLLCASPHYLVEHGVPRTPEDLHEHQCLMLHDQHTWRFRKSDGSELRVRVSGRFRCNLGEGTREAALAGLGITLKSVWNCHRELDSGALVPVLSDFPLIDDSAVWAVYPSQRQLAPRVRALIDHLQQCWREPPWSRSAPATPRPTREE